MLSIADPSGAALPPGARAPDFVLADADGRPIRLSDLRGQPVILAFYPLDWDPSRADQLTHFNWLVRQVPGVHAELLGISMDGMWCRLAFAGDELRVPLLADLDPRGAVAERYGVRDGQALFVIDADGRIAWRHAGPVGSVPPSEELVAALAALKPPDVAATPLEERAALAPCLRRSDGDAGDALLTPSRREFVATALAAALALAASPLLARAETLTSPLAPERPEQAPVRVTLTVNGRPLTLTIEPRVTMLDALREQAGLTGSKKGCDHGQCGACTVHVNGRRQLSCLTFAVTHEGSEITTIEGLASGDTLHPMQTAFIAHDGFQCGYCTSGQIMSATALLKEPCGPSDADVRECMSGNLCRCGAYPGIVAAIQDVRATARG